MGPPLGVTTGSHEGQFPEGGEARQLANRPNSLSRPFQPVIPYVSEPLTSANIPTCTF